MIDQTHNIEGKITTLAALRIARQEGVTTIFNPAPARPNLPQALYQLGDIPGF